MNYSIDLGAQVIAKFVQIQYSPDTGPEPVLFYVGRPHQPLHHAARHGLAFAEHLAPDFAKNRILGGMDRKGMGLAVLLVVSAFMAIETA